MTSKGKELYKTFKRSISGVGDVSVFLRPDFCKVRADSGQMKNYFS